MDREIYRNVIASLTEGVVIANASGQIVEMNQEALKIHGFSSLEEMFTEISRYKDDFWLERDGKPLPFEEWPVYRMLRGERFHNFLVRVHSRKRSFDACYSGTPIHDEKGGVPCGVLVIQDLSQQKLAIENERENFRNLFKQTPEMVCILKGPEHVFEFVNEAHIRVLGFDATGMAVRVAQPESVEVHGILDDVYRTGITAELNEIPVTVTDRLRYFNLTYAARRDEFGKVNGVMILGSEVTEQVLSRRKLEESNRRFRDLANSMPQIVYITSDDGKSSYLNDQWYKYTGQNPSTPDNTLLAVHPDDREVVIEKWMEADKTHNPFSMEVRLRDKDGNYRWFISRAIPILNKEGPVRWYGTSTDIHDLKLLEQQTEASNLRAEESENRLRLALKASKIGFYDWNLKTDAAVFSQELVDILGLPEKPKTMAEAFKLVHPDDLPRVNDDLKEAIEKEIQFSKTYRVYHAQTGEIVWIGVRGEVQKDRLSQPIRFVGTAIDLTQQKEIEMALRQMKSDADLAREEAENANRLKSAFLANMSHEIRTPLGAIVGFADLLRDPSITPSERSNYTNIIARNGEQLSGIIDDILDLSKVEAGHLSLDFLKIDPNEIVRDVLSLLRVKANEKGIRLDFVADRSTPSRIVTDPLRLKQILLNVVGNALKFTRSGSVTVRTSSEMVKGNRKIFFKVTDTGVGIPQKEKERVFMAFVQADGTLSRKYGGTGLGLALSRQLANQLGGNLELVSSKINKGSVFLISIEDQPARIANNRDQEARAGTIEIDRSALSGKSILIVDDSPDNQQLISRYLSKYGASVHFAANGIEGCKMALEGSYDLVLMDIQMPEMDGYTATARLRESGYTGPIIALTAHAMTGVRSKCLAVGCNDHIAKPIRSRDLIAAVARFTSEKHLSKSAP